MKNKSFIPFFINATYFLVVFLAAFSLATLALARKINSYEFSRERLVFNVTKEEMEVSNPVSGRIEKIFVQNGQHVAKGELLIKMSDQELKAKIQSLEQVADSNLSARTEASLLKTQTPFLEIRAPSDGVIYKIQVGEGATLNQNSPLITMFADANVKLFGYVKAQQYDEIQKNKEVEVYSPRFEQSYGVVFEGVGRVISATQYDVSKYEVEFHFRDPNEGPAFIQGEGLEVLKITKQIEVKRPAEVVAKFWNSFIIGR